MNTPLAEENIPLNTEPPRDTLTPKHHIALEDKTPEINTAARDREDAVEAVYTWQRLVKTKESPLGEWQEYVLEPYSEARERLFHRLCESDVPLPPLRELRNLDAYASHAVKILYLCSHRPEEFRHLRANPGLFVEAIEEWGSINVPRAQTIKAVTLALKIHNAAQTTLAVAPGSGKTSSKN